MTREMAERRDNARWAGFEARRAQDEIFELLVLLKTPEAALLISPYLFDTSLGFTPDGCLMAGAPNSMALSKIHKLPVPEKPTFKVLYPDHDTLLRAWQEWWLRMAPAFDAEPPSAITVTRAEVVALNAKVHPDPKKLEELMATAVVRPFAPVVPDTADVPQTPGPIWLWILPAMLLCLVATAVYGFRKKSHL